MAVIVAGLIGLGIGLYILQRSLRRQAVRRWAIANNFKLLAFDQPGLTEASPFPITVSKAQQVFYVSVMQKDGRRRSGWLLLGSGMLGLASDDVEVKWDDGGV